MTCENQKKDCFLEGAFKKMHVNFSSSIVIGTFSSEDRRNRKIGGCMVGVTRAAISVTVGRWVGNVGCRW